MASLVLRVHDLNHLLHDQISGIENLLHMCRRAELYTWEWLGQPSRALLWLNPPFPPHQLMITQAACETPEMKWSVPAVPEPVLRMCEA